MNGYEVDPDPQRPDHFGSGDAWCTSTAASPAPHGRRPRHGTWPNKAHRSVTLEAVAHDVEAIDTTGYGANKVSLSIDDVLNMTDGDNRLTIVVKRVTRYADRQRQQPLDRRRENAQFTTYAYSDPSMQAVVETVTSLTRR
jgi:hypothetical protein